MTAQDHATEVGSTFTFQTAERGNAGDCHAVLALRIHVWEHRVRRSLTRSQRQHAAATVFLLLALVCLLEKISFFGVSDSLMTQRIQQYSTEMRFHGSCY